MTATDSAAPAPGAVPSSRPEELPLLPRRTITAFVLAYAGAFLILIVPVALTLALRVQEVAPDTKESTLGIISACGAAVALLANPVFGALSDRTTSRFGMRRPWIVGGSLVGTAALLVVALAPGAMLIGFGWVVVQGSMNAVLSGLAAFLPDRVPAQQRGKVSALAGIAQQVSPFIGIMVANISLAVGWGTVGMFVVPALLGLLLIGFYAFTVQDRVLPAAQRRPMSIGTVFGAFVFNPRRNPDFGWAWLGRFFVTLAFAFNSTYQVYFMGDRLGFDVEKIASTQLLAVGISSVCLAVSAAVAGTISDRTGRRKVFVFVAATLAALATGMLAFTHDLPMFLVASVISGIGVGAYFAVDLALVTDVLPDKESAAAKDMGVFNIANALPQSLAPAIAPVLLAIGGGGNYTVLYLAAATAAVVGGLTVVPIRSVR